MESSNRTQKVLVALVVALALVAAAQMFFLLGLNERVHALVGQAADQEASGDRDQTTPRSHAKPEGREAEDPDDTRIEPRRPFYMRPFDPHTWDPFQEISEMRKRIDALFEDAFGRFGKSARFGDLATEFSFEPTMDVKEEDGRYVIRLDVPGADVTDLKASIENNTLTIEGTRKQEKEESRRGEYLRQERRIGTFRRSFPLPGPVAPESLDTSYKDGVFTITVEKAGATQDNSESGS